MNTNRFDRAMIVVDIVVATLTLLTYICEPGLYILRARGSLLTEVISSATWTSIALIRLPILKVYIKSW